MSTRSPKDLTYKEAIMIAISWLMKCTDQQLADFIQEHIERNPETNRIVVDGVQSA